MKIFKFFFHNRLIHPKTEIRKSGFLKTGYFQKVDILIFGKVNISIKWIFQKVDIFTVTVSGDLEIKKWFSNEPLLAVKK